MVTRSTTSCDFGVAVETSRGKTGEHVVARLAAAIVDVARESLVQVFQRAVLQGVVAGAADAGLRSPSEHCGELIAVLLGHAEQIGDDQQAERSLAVELDLYGHVPGSEQLEGHDDGLGAGFLVGESGLCVISPSAGRGGRGLAARA